MRTTRPSVILHNNPWFFRNEDPARPVSICTDAITDITGFPEHKLPLTLKLTASKKNPRRKGWVRVARQRDGYISVGGKKHIALDKNEAYMRHIKLTYPFYVKVVAI